MENCRIPNLSSESYHFCPKIYKGEEICQLLVDAWQGMILRMDIQNYNCSFFWQKTDEFGGAFLGLKRTPLPIIESMGALAGYIKMNKIAIGIS